MIVNFESEFARRKNLPYNKKSAPHDLPAGNEATVNVVVEIREGFRQVIAAINDNELRGRGRRSGFRAFPRMLSKVQAASYCGMGVESFAVNCPVKPIRMRPGDRGLRWDIRELDEWIDSLKQDSTGSENSENVDWLARFDGQNQDKRREGLRQQG
jgi:hypothetical protein